MINYSQLGRNLRKYTLNVEPKLATYIYNPKGIYDFKQIKPEIKDALTEAFKDVEYPVLELSVKNSSKTKGTIILKDGHSEFSHDTFVLNEGEKIENYLPETDGCIKKMTYDKKGIEEIKKQNRMLNKFIGKLTEKIQNPILELWVKERSKYTIGNVVIKDGDKVVLNGYFSKDKKIIPTEKYHFSTDTEIATGYSRGNDRYGKKFAKLTKALISKLWMLDNRAKIIMKKYFGVGCSPKSSNQIAENMNITGSRVREIVSESKAYLNSANTYNKDLNADLNELGHILSEEERYNIVRNQSSIDINKAETKIIKHKQKLKI